MADVSAIIIFTNCAFYTSTVTGSDDHFEVQLYTFKPEFRRRITLPGTLLMAVKSNITDEITASLMGNNTWCRGIYSCDPGPTSLFALWFKLTIILGSRRAA